MNVLVIGDEHTYGYGLRTGQLSYVNHFVRQLGRSGQTVRVEAYAHLNPHQMVAMLSQLPLNRYDLIVLQTDERLCRPVPTDAPPAPVTAVPVCLPLPGSPPSTFGNQWQRRFMPGLRTLGKVVLSAAQMRLRPERTGIQALLTLLKPYRHTVVILTPFPQRVRATGWLRGRVRTHLLRQAGAPAFSLFDAGQVVQPREEYFLLNDPEHLNAVSHELLGRALFDFYQSAPTVITMPTLRRQGR